ncbi:MAG: hypothetical protein MJ085_04480 [Clostridia bacterium]|nr:hypothetical protein [Clostridia bacterium]
MSATIEYKCPCCGGKIEFDSTLQQMKCPYCDTTFDVEAMLTHDEALNQPAEDQMQWKTEQEQSTWEGDVNVYVCQSCGGQILADENTAATHCPYCGNPVMLTDRLSGDLKPDYVIPFKLDKNAAKDALKKHFSGKKLLPRLFSSEHHIDEIKGLYVPFWLFDADADANIRYKATSVRVWSDSKYNYTETSFYSLQRSGVLSFDNIPVDGSLKMPDDLMESLEPFDFSQAVDFQTAYLSGYLADRYDVSAEDSIERANIRVKKTTEQAFAQTVTGYASVTPEASDIRLSNAKHKYAFFPVWLLNTTWNGKQYVFAMNGQTGKIVGDLPIDKKLLWRYRLLYSGIIGAAIYGLIWLIKLSGLL